MSDKNDEAQEQAPASVGAVLEKGQGLAASLSWRSGLLGAWGMTVGPATMGAPPSDLSGWPDYSLDVSSGVCIWHDRE
ncbi:MAG: hypothetical protein JSW27_15525 [Phycisphaerales bacterium]|nr:MAG: hypothetical protein JSW27_15525 [Phycisphaerales bacterium]